MTVGATAIDESSSSSTGDTTSMSTTTGETTMNCPYGELMVGDTLTVDTVGQDDEFVNTCGGGGSPDVSYTFTAPMAGTYFFTASAAVGSSINPILAIRDGLCGGPELACNDNADASTFDARVAASLSGGETVTVIIDGFALAGGEADVTVEFFEGMCPDDDAGSAVPVTVSGSTVDSDNTTFSSCGGSTGNDEQYTFIAPTTDTYAIDTAGSDFDTVLHVFDSCGGSELACDDNADGLTSRLNIDLVAGQEIVVVVDAFGMESGDYDLNIDVNACPNAELTGPLPITVTGNTGIELDTSSGSCTVGNAPDFSYTFTAPQDGVYVFDTIGSAFDTAIYAFAGEACAGVELGCDDDGLPSDFFTSLLALSMTADETITLVVDGDTPVSSGDYILNVSAVDSECGNEVLELAEECDGGTVPDTCFSLGLGGGQLTCDSVTCQYDTSACGQNCNNGTIDPGEACDLSEYDGETCETQGFAGGPLGCSADCTTFDTSQCSNDLIAICSSPAATIDSVVPVTDTINVPQVGAIADVDVFIDITHTFVADLDMFLFADDLGLSNELSTDSCFFYDDVFATFNDEGDYLVDTTCVEPVAIEGNLIPESALSVYDGQTSNGSWTLSIVDDVSGDVGTLNEWCLYITLE